MWDLDPQALERTRNEIYPVRYGEWDTSIELEVIDDIDRLKGADLVIIGTPPNSHVELIRSLLTNDAPPKVILVEKPLATPDLRGCLDLKELSQQSGCTVIIDYNHTRTPNTIFSEDLIQQGHIGNPETIQVRWIEHWGGIYKAHPWLSGPADTYLGFAIKGGGACGEHSHGINLWQHFARQVGAGRVVEVSALLDLVEEDGANYDRLCQLNLKTESGLCGFVVQDVVTAPPVKSLRVQGSEGFLEWHANFDSSNDAVLFGQSDAERKLFKKTRPEDFVGMIDQVEQLLNGSLAANEAVSSLDEGLETMLVIAAAFESNRTQKTVKIDYSKGCSQEALDI